VWKAFMHQAGLQLQQHGLKAGIAEIAVHFSKATIMSYYFIVIIYIFVLFGGAMAGRPLIRSNVTRIGTH
jgi:hypothetical protein